MPFLEHLEELRWRIVKSLAALMVAFSLSFWFCWNYDVITILARPIAKYLKDGQLIYTGPVDPFMILMQLAGGLGIVLASPVIGYQFWSFLAPALTQKERRVIVPLLAFAALLFLAGVALAVFVFIPVTLSMMTGIKTTALVPMIAASEYFSFLVLTSLAFGAVFEMPILVLALTALGLVTPKALSKVRRWAIVVSLVLCEIVTPGDLVITTLMLWIPVYGLYEFSIVVSWFVYRAKMKRAAAAESIGSEATA